MTAKYRRFKTLKLLDRQIGKMDYVLSGYQWYLDRHLEEYTDIKYYYKLRERRRLADEKRKKAREERKKPNYRKIRLRKESVLECL